MIDLDKPEINTPFQFLCLFSLFFIITPSNSHFEWFSEEISLFTKRVWSERIRFATEIFHLWHNKERKSRVQNLANEIRSGLHQGNARARVQEKSMVSVKWNKWKTVPRKLDKHW